MSEFSNPYAAPQASAGPLPHSEFKNGEPQPWTPTEVLSTAWGLFKPNWAPLLGALVVGYIIIMVVQQVLLMIPMKVMNRAIEAPMLLTFTTLFVVTIGSSIAQSLVMSGWVRLFLMPARGQQADFRALFSSFEFFLPMLLATLANMALIYLGFLALIVPGVILSLGTVFYSFFIVDGAAPLDALKQSWAATRGHKGSVFGLLFLIGLLNVAGALACGVGMLVTLPVSFLALAVTYTRLTGRGAPREGASF